VVSYRPFARQVPLDANGLPLTFDELAQPMRGHFSRWGVLRMDVDNLGRLFQTGFGEKASLSRTASLSFAFRIFFEGWLPHLVKPQAGDAIAQADLSRYIYIQYSGGDDLFVVGAWDALPEFARRVRSSLAQYACGNPAITLSAGMAIADKGFPLYQAARQAGEAEEQAKAFRRPGAGHREKDAFTFLETPMDWQTLADIQEQAYTLADSIQSGRIKHSLLQTILSLDAQIRHANRQGKKFRFGPWAWMAAYQLSRVAEAARNQQEKELVMMIREKFINPDETTAALGLAARWAQFLTRGG
jgi:CRISPR-associated protein Csm1